MATALHAQVLGLTRSWHTWESYNQYGKEAPLSTHKWDSCSLVICVACSIHSLPKNYSAGRKRQRNLCSLATGSVGPRMKMHCNCTNNLWAINCQQATSRVAIFKLFNVRNVVRNLKTKSNDNFKNCYCFFLFVFINLLFLVTVWLGFYLIFHIDCSSLS